MSLWESVRIRHVIFGTLPCVSITSLNQDANMSTTAGQPSEKSKKIGAKGSVAVLKESIQLSCVSRVSQDSHPRKSKERRKFGIKSHRQFLQGHVAPHKKKNIGKERVHREASFRSVNLMSAVRAPPSLRRGHKTQPCTKIDAPAE